jgi:uncharacterized 2Fe-2S/4Fe-4S cluster protein (DUF4445 family)
MWPPWFQPRAEGDEPLPILIVKLVNEERRIPFSADRSLREILDATEVRVRSGCCGMGTCGLCRVRIEVGEAGVPTPNELLMLDSAELEQGVRLACQVMPEYDLQIELLAPAPKSHWRSLPDGAGQRIRREPLFSIEGLPQETNPYGLAVDLGTTHISLSMYELSGGKWLAGRYGLNPQMQYGSDVMTRLVAASGSPAHARDMGRQLIDAIREGLFDIAVREGLNIGHVVRVALVGNSAMLALLSGRNYSLLLQPKHWMTCLDCLPENPAAWADSLGIHPHAKREVIPPLAGFVGSDLLAGVVATRLTDYVSPGLFIDFGTNSEIALWDGVDLWATSAAGGPAFEESGISCGAPAEPGAIFRVRLSDGVFAFEVIADTEPCGICGSGLVDLIACLVRSGQLTETGRFAAAVPGEGFALARGERDIVLSKRDVDMFQRAKAAIGTGIQILLAEAGLGCDDLRRICVGGFFGRFLDIANAGEIGLLPYIPPGQVELCGNTALAGCAEALLSSVAAERLRNLGERAKLVNLSSCPDFDELFLRNLYLLPMGESE